MKTIQESGKEKPEGKLCGTKGITEQELG